MTFGWLNANRLVLRSCDKKRKVIRVYYGDKGKQVLPTSGAPNRRTTPCIRMSREWTRNRDTSYTRVAPR